MHFLCTWYNFRRQTWHTLHWRAMRKRVFGHMRTFLVYLIQLQKTNATHFQGRSRLACASIQSEQDFHCPLRKLLGPTKCIYGAQRLRWYFAHAQDDLNLHILCIFEDTFSLDAAHLIFCIYVCYVFRLLSCFLTNIIMFRPKRKLSRAYAKCTESNSSHACAKSHPGICYRLVHFTVSNDYVRGQRRLWSDCADAQADLSLYCPHMPGDTFLHGAAHIMAISCAL